MSESLRRDSFTKSTQTIERLLRIRECYFYGTESYIIVITMNTKHRGQDKQSITVDMRTVGEIKLDGEGVIMIRTNLDTLKLYFNGANIQHIDYTITRPEEIYISDGKSSFSKERAKIAIYDDEDFVNEQIELLETNGGRKSSV